IRQDVQSEDAPRRRIEKIPAARVEPVTGLLEAIDGGKDARQMFGVDRDDEAWAGQTAAETRAHTGVAAVVRHERSKAIVAERSGCPRGRDVWRGFGPARATDPRDHHLLQAGYRLALEARRLLALE